MMNDLIEANAQKAEQFLLEHLTDRQREEYVAERKISVKTRDKNRYIIFNRPRIRTVIALDDTDLPCGSYCIVFKNGPSTAPPDEDLLLAKKLLLENDEMAFLACAKKQCMCHSCRSMLYIAMGKNSHWYQP